MKYSLLTLCDAHKKQVCGRISKKPVERISNQARRHWGGRGAGGAMPPNNLPNLFLEVL